LTLGSQRGLKTRKAGQDVDVERDRGGHLQIALGAASDRDAAPASRWRADYRLNLDKPSWMRSRNGPAPTGLANWLPSLGHNSSAHDRQNREPLGPETFVRRGAAYRV
jgi:hypothetical protein